MTAICARQDHRSLYRQLMAGMYDALLVTDPNGHLIELNPRAMEYFLYKPEDVFDKPVGTLIPGVSTQMVGRIRKGLDDARHIMLDAKCQRKDGSAFTAEVTISVIDLINTGDLVFTVRNTERRRKQWQSMRSMANAFSNAQCAGFVCDNNRVFKAVNRAFLEMFGAVEEAEVLGRAFEDLMPDDPLPGLFGQALAGETVTCRIGADTENGDGAEVDVRMAPDLHAKDNIVGVVGSMLQV
ncbi:MAG: PAS domain S-box protein [Kiritimatiellae bacterium]|nr:PAS domain S-box protein [Kiritimatiellia bacterium]